MLNSDPYKIGFEIVENPYENIVGIIYYQVGHPIGIRDRVKAKIENRIDDQVDQGLDIDIWNLIRAAVLITSEELSGIEQLEEETP